MGCYKVSRFVLVGRKHFGEHLTRDCPFFLPILPFLFFLLVVDINVLVFGPYCIVSISSNSAGSRPPTANSDGGQVSLGLL